jgi:N-acetylglutamate synthase
LIDLRIEEASLNAWPALEQVLLDGWLIRFSRGYTKRANSVNPLYPSAVPLEEHVQRCEELYRARQQPCIFRLNSITAPGRLDQVLADRDYRVVDPSLVLQLDLESAHTLQPLSRRLKEEPLDTWLDLYCRFHGLTRDQQFTHETMLQRIPGGRLLASLPEGTEVAAIGLGVLGQDCFGLFDLVTAPTRRKRGNAAALVTAMLNWAQERGGKHAYLQVVETNIPARRLYKNLGFRELYRYWYRAPAD